jgi:hypothetical protein
VIGSEASSSFQWLHADSDRADMRPLQVAYKGQSITVELPGVTREGDGEGVHFGYDMSVVDHALYILKEKVDGIPAPAIIRRVPCVCPSAAMTFIAVRSPGRITAQRTAAPLSQARSGPTFGLGRAAIPQTDHHLHAMRPVSDPIGDLEFAYVLHDRRKLRLSHLGLRRHIAVRPMVLPHAQLGREKKRPVTMVSRIVDVVNQGWPFCGAGGVAPVASGAIRLEGRFALNGQR